MCKKIKLSQVGNAWHEWRSQGIGASEMAVIAGALPFVWGDVLKLWKFKTKMTESDFVMTDAVAQGKKLEPKARKRYIEITGTKIAPACYEHDLSFIKASLDGITKDEKHIVEIKVPGLPNFRKAKNGILVNYYYPQMQSQLLCSGAKTCHYFVYRPDEGAVLINVPRNDEYIEELIRRSTIFWEGVENGLPVLPRHLGIDMSKDSDPLEVGNMEVELIGHYKNPKKKGA